MSADFPSARSLLVRRSQRTIKKTGATSSESRPDLSSVAPGEYRPAHWLGLMRGHWGGVEIRHHWRRDAVMGEDRSRSRHPRLLANLALLRRTLPGLMAEHFPERPLPEIREHLHSRPTQCLRLLAK